MQAALTPKLSNTFKKYLAQAQHDKAIEEYQAAIKLAPEFSLAILYLGDTYYQQEKYAEAIEWFQRAIEVNPGLLQGWEFLGDAYRNIGLAHHARRAYVRALMLEPKDNLARSGFESLGQALKQ